MEAMVETTRMSTKGQLLIPKHIREFTNSKKDSLFTVVPLNNETIILKKINSNEMIKEFRKLRSEIKNKLSEDEINEIVHKVR